MRRYALWCPVSYMSRGSGAAGAPGRHGPGGGRGASLGYGDAANLTVENFWTWVKAQYASALRLPGRGESVRVLLAIGGIGIVIGLATWGYRVMETIGKKITELTPSRGFAAELAAATTIVVASRLGIPISTTHTLVGAVLGVGLARGIGALDLRVVGKILASWVATLPLAAGLSIFFFYFFKGLLAP